MLLVIVTDFKSYAEKKIIYLFIFKGTLVSDLLFCISGEIFTFNLFEKTPQTPDLHLFDVTYFVFFLP